MAEQGADEHSLPSIFTNILSVYEFLESSSDSDTIMDIQKKVIKGSIDAERAVGMVNDLNLFSSNESIEEIATNEIRFMLLPALLGYFTEKNRRLDRLEVLNKAKIYYLDFLKLVKLYEVMDFQIPKDKDDDEETMRVPPQLGMPDMNAMADERATKLQRYKQQKELETRLSSNKSQVESGNADEEVKREYYLNLLKQWIYRSLGELDSFKDELSVLKYMAKMKNDPDALEHHERQIKEQVKTKKPMRPFILTKDKVQAAVFGAGYKSLPTYTIEEFYENRYKDEIEQATNGLPPQSSMSEAEEAEKQAFEKEKKEEEDDKEMLTKARNWDDWKDDHRRGWGNRQNMG